MTSGKNFIDLNTINKKILRKILDLGKKLKASSHGEFANSLNGKTLAMIFEKPSTRTRVSFEVGMRQLGGEVVTLLNENIQSGRGETFADTARVLSRYVDILMIRTDSSSKLEELSSFSSIPVINGLTNLTHPCQIMADIMTFEEHKGDIKGKVLAWTGDGNNVANTLIQGAVQFDFTLRLACPPELGPDKKILEWGKRLGANIKLTDDPYEAVDNADCVITDTWVSMHNKQGDRVKTLEPYRVTKKLMNSASKSAIFMHCLPAHRGEEVVTEVIDGPNSVVWDEAENRLHVQKAILLWILAINDF